MTPIEHINTVKSNIWSMVGGFLVGVTILAVAAEDFEGAVFSGFYVVVCFAFSIWYVFGDGIPVYDDTTNRLGTNPHGEWDSPL